MLWLLLMILMSSMESGVEAQNSHGDPCTNQCQQGNPENWCGERRRGPDGRVMRCVEGSRTGQVCVDSCSAKDEDYFWCWTNAHKWGQPWSKLGDHWWNKCGVTDHTVRGKPCVGPCGQQGERYWWCRDDAQSSSSWDYCSPTGEVRPVGYTVRGHACLGECAQHGENYWWCSKSTRWGKAKKNRKGEWVMKSGTDYWWDYCSPSKTRTRYNIACTSDCVSDGEKYFWCYTGGSKWDYCSPEPSSTEEITSKGGWTCNGVCSKMASSYDFCEIRGKASFFEKSWWDFCTPK